MIQSGIPVLLLFAQRLFPVWAFYLLSDQGCQRQFSCLLEGREGQRKRTLGTMVS